MTAKRIEEAGVEAAEQNLEPELPEEAPAGASSEPEQPEPEQPEPEQPEPEQPEPEQPEPEQPEPEQPEPEREQPEPDGGPQVQDDLDELALKAAKADAYLALAQRTQADFENYRRRAVREAGLAQDRGVARLAKELLPALDHLDLALKAAGEEDSPLAEGIKLVQSDLLSALQRVGVEQFSPDGEPFDPQFHEAVAQQPIEGVDSGLVAEVFQQGYRLGESVLRPARVLVAA